MREQINRRESYSVGQLGVAGGGLLLLLILSVSLLPGAFRGLVPLAVLMVVVLLSSPMIGLSLAFLGRLWIDLFWDVGIGGTNIMVFYGGAVVFLGGVFVWLQFRQSVQHPLIVPIVMYLGLMVIAGAQGSTIVMWAGVFAKQLGPMIMLVLFHVFFVGKPKLRENLVLGIVGFAVVPVGYGLYLYYSGQHLEWLGPFPRLLGGYHNVHIASHLMILFAVTGLFQFRVATHSWHKLLLFLFIAGALFFHINTFVRTTTVGLLVYLATLLYVQRRIDILFTLIIVVFAVYTQSEFVGERFGEIETLLTQDRTLEQDSMGSGRVGFYRRGIVEFLSRPLFNIIFGLGLAESMDLGKYQHDIHSDYLFLLFSMGPGGLLLYLWMQVRVVLGAVWVRKFSSDVWERKFAEHVVALNALVMLVNAISNSYVTRLTAGWIFWGTCGILLATETDLRVRLAKAAAATKEIVKGAPAIAGNWDPAFAPSIGKRNIDVTRGERPGLGRHWKPLNPPKSSGKE